jgi:hypothetical protein
MDPVWMVTLELSLHFFYAVEEVFNNSIYLGTLASVFQAELYAITQACSDIVELLNDHCPLIFYIGSQATL